MADMTLCWDCKRSYEQTCSWSRDFKPVSGWYAQKVKVNCSDGKNDRMVDSYCVVNCPCFVRDSYGGGQYRLRDFDKYQRNLIRKVNAEVRGET